LTDKIAEMRIRPVPWQAKDQLLDNKLKQEDQKHHLQRQDETYQRTGTGRSHNYFSACSVFLFPKPLLP